MSAESVSIQPLLFEFEGFTLLDSTGHEYKAHWGTFRISYRLVNGRLLIWLTLEDLRLFRGDLQDEVLDLSPSFLSALRLKNITYGCYLDSFSKEIGDELFLSVDSFVLESVSGRYEVLK